MYLHDEPNEPTKEGPFSYVFRESPFALVWQFGQSAGPQLFDCTHDIESTADELLCRKNSFLQSSNAEIISVCSREIVPLMRVLT
jgi:hypothetical protein